MTNNYIYFVANWKMFGGIKSLNSLGKVIKFSKLSKKFKFKLIYCPPYTLLHNFVQKLKNTKIEVGGHSGGELVKVKLNGEGEMINIEISDNLLKEDKNVIEDLIKAAHNNAKSNLKSKTSEEISKSAGNFGIPGFKWPL